MLTTIIGAIALLADILGIGDAVDLIEVAGPKLGAALIIFLVIVALIVMIWRSVSAERRLRIQFANQQESNRVALEKSKLELEASRQKSDAAETSSLYKIFDKFVDIQTENQKLMGDQISSRSELQLMVKALQTKTENLGNWQAMASENEEAFQSWLRGSVAAQEQRDKEKRQLLEPVPPKLETILEGTIAAKIAAKAAEAEIKTVGSNVLGAITKLTSIENMLHAIEESVQNMKSDLLKSTAAANEPPSISALVAAMVEPKADEPEK